MNETYLAAIDALVARIRPHLARHPGIEEMRPADLLGIEGLVLADLGPTTSQIAAAIDRLRAEFA